MKARWISPFLVAPLALATPAAAAPVQPSADVKPTMRILDREVVQCSQSARMVTKLERDGARLEVDAEIFGPARERWVIKIKQNGKLVHKIARNADYDGELDIWRYLPNRPGEDRVKIKARAADGERCVAKLRG